MRAIDGSRVLLCAIVFTLGCGSGGADADADAVDAAAVEDAPPFTGLCPPSYHAEAPVALFDPLGLHADRSTPIPSDVWTTADSTTVET
mgnify:FL=1